MLCRRLDMVPVECVARGYLTGSGLADYRATGGVVGQPLPPGLEDGSRLPEPVFTPATKAAVGDHDENVTFEAVAQPSAPSSPPSCAGSRSRSTPAAPRWPPSAASCSPTPSSSSATTATAS